MIPRGALPHKLCLGVGLILWQGSQAFIPVSISHGFWLLLGMGVLSWVQWLPLGRGQFCGEAGSQEKPQGHCTSPSWYIHNNCKINTLVRAMSDPRSRTPQAGDEGILPLSVWYRFLGGQSLVLASSMEACSK